MLLISTLSKCINQFTKKGGRGKYTNNQRAWPATPTQLMQIKKQKL